MRRAAGKSGFTLIELLVVIAIVAILAAILFPVFVHARESARTAKCQAHQRELISALMMYTEAYNGKLPHIQFLTDGYVGWQYICLYRPYVKNFDILLCPGTYIERDYNRGRGIRHLAFAYNESCLCGMPTVKVTSVAHSNVYEVAGSYNTWPGRPFASIVRTSRCPAFFCAASLHVGVHKVPNGFGWECDDIDDVRMVNPHNDGTNYAFLDGHVKWYLPNGGNGWRMRTDGIDYDGNGSIGQKDFMR